MSPLHTSFSPTFAPCIFSASFPHSSFSLIIHSNRPICRRRFHSGSRRRRISRIRFPSNFTSSRLPILYLPLVLSLFSFDLHHSHSPSLNLETPRPLPKLPHHSLNRNFSSPQLHPSQSNVLLELSSNQGRSILEDGESRGNRTSHDFVRERSGNSSVDREEGVEAEEELSGSKGKEGKNAEEKKKEEDSAWEQRFEISIRSYRLVLRSATQQHQARPFLYLGCLLQF